MEIFESQDPEKKRLMDEAKKHKDALSGDVQAVSERTDAIIKNALLIGGALALTYVVVRSFSGRKSKKKKTRTVKLVAQAPQGSSSNGATEEEEEDQSDSLLSQIGTKIANEATVLLLSLAKEKLAEYLNAGKEKNEDHRNS
jgi:hypothetical protein